MSEQRGQPERGAGDRWLAGERIDGVAFAHHAAVEVRGGRFDGDAGRVELVLLLGADPLYLVTLERGGAVKVRQSSLRQRT